MIRVDKTYYFDRFLLTDEQRLMETINDKEIARNTLTVPYPYSLEDAQWWLQQCELQDNCGETKRNWAIRNSEGLVCGGIGRHYKYGFKSHKDEIGYWLMRPLWGQGVMTNVVRTFTEYCLESEGLKRLEAPIFEFNTASARVLEKNGFLLEGRLIKAYLKEGTYYDSLLYAKTVD